MLPDKVTIVEVGPRDGLQNEPTPVPTAGKLAFIHNLVDAGLTHVEATSFVSPKAVPQLADADELLKQLHTTSDTVVSALVPNPRGLERAMKSGVKRIAVFTAASETFTQKNIRMTIAESLDTFRPVISTALAEGMTVRGYLSTCFVCPYEGDVPKSRVRELTECLLELGVDEVAISDTIGAAAPSDVTETVGYVLERVPVERIGLHFHDTYGTALANVYAGLQLGVTTFDASAGGLGGCPFAPGAAGNLATEDLVYMLDRMGINTGIDGHKVVAAAEQIAARIGRPLPSRQSARLRQTGPSASSGRC